MDKEMQELVAFTEAVCTAAMEDGALYGSLDKTAFRQYFIEVMMPMGYHWQPEEWFNDTTGTPPRKQWGDSIRSIYQSYQKKMTESAAATEQPEGHKELLDELATIRAGLAALQAQLAKPEPAPEPAAPAGEETAGEA